MSNIKWVYGQSKSNKNQSLNRKFNSNLFINYNKKIVNLKLSIIPSCRLYLIFPPLFFIFQDSLSSYCFKINISCIIICIYIYFYYFIKRKSLKYSFFFIWILGNITYVNSIRNPIRFMIIFYFKNKRKFIFFPIINRIISSIEIFRDCFCKFYFILFFYYFLIKFNLLEYLYFFPIRLMYFHKLFSYHMALKVASRILFKANIFDNEIYKAFKFNILLTKENNFFISFLLSYCN